MKTRLFACAAALLVPLFAAPLPAQSGASTEAAPPTATRPADLVKEELDALVERVKARLQEGKNTEAELAEELKAFDDLSAKYAGRKTESTAMIGVMKAMLYVQVFEKPETGLPILKKVLADFPGTQAAAEIPAMIERIEQIAASEAATAMGKKFVPFKEPATDGTVVDLAAYKGKVVLIDFWATWCGPCVDELPHVKAAYEKHHAQGFEIVGISLDKDGDKLAAFTKENQMPWPQIFDGKGWQAKLAQVYGIRSIPATFLLDRDGKIVAKGLRGDALSKKVGELLAEKP